MSFVNVGYAQDFLKRDTLIIQKSDLESPIYYSARDSIYTDLRKKQVHLYGDAKVDNGEVKMNAGYILIDLDKNEVLAMYAYDKDSNRVELPSFSDGSDQINASTIRYNFTTEKGYIEEVAIVQDENHLYMEIAKRHANEEIHFKKGRFTTCDLEEPHYHFQLSKAVLIPNKRIVSGPMNLWIAGVPTPLGLPFAVIPQAEEKTKGLIFPQFVPISQFGFGLQDLGYYVPVNDHLQTTFYGTLYSRGSWGLRNVTDYAKLYGFRGSLSAGFQQFKSGFPSNSNRNKLSIGWIHTKDPKSSPYWGFSANVNYISDNNTQNNLDPLNPDYFNNTLTSDVNLSRAFPGKPVTAGMKLGMRQNSTSKNVSLTSPIVNVNVTRVFPFKNLVTGSKGWRQLFTRFGVAYNFEGKNQSIFVDSLLTTRDLKGIGDEFINGISQTITMQTTASLFNNTWKLTPSINYGNKINFQQIEKIYDSVNDSIIVNDIRRADMAHDLSINAQLTTVLYSYYRFVGKKKPLVRHVLTPSFGFRYIPNLNETKTLISGTGINLDTLIYSPFERSIYSVGQVRDQSLITFGFNNTLELKRKNDKDTVDGFKRTRLIDALSITGSYDLIKEATYQLSDISLNLRISPLKWLNIVSNSSFSAYGWDSLTGKKKEEFAIKSNGVLGRFTTTNITTTATLTSKEGREEIEKTQNRINDNWTADYAYFALHPEHALNFNIPWKVTLSHIYGVSVNQNITSSNADRFTQLQTLMANGDLSFTKRWKVATTTNLDLATGQITNSRFTLTRDMHCWALAFHWTPIGGNKSFLFSIRSTSMLFQDAKIDIRKPPSFL